MLSYLSIAAIIWYGGGKVVEGALQFGVLYAFINYVGLFFQPINDLAEKYNILQASMAASERIFQVLDTEKETDEGSLVFERNSLNAAIEFRNVWFAYKDEEWVLRDVSFRVPAGSTVAIVGATGAGKTSIINLLNRFYEIRKGEILIGGINIKDVASEIFTSCSTRVCNCNKAPKIDYKGIDSLLFTFGGRMIVYIKILMKRPFKMAV